MDKKELIYISGPVSLGGTSTEEVIAEFSRKFVTAERWLRQLGYEVINPINCEPQATWEDYMKLHIPSVCRADAVAVLPQWMASRGSMLEVFIATQLKIPVSSIEEYYDGFS